LKKILIIGALGYLGSRLTDYLLEKAYIVTNLDIGLFQYGILYYPSPMGYIHKNAKEIDEIDIENHDVVILLAGYVLFFTDSVILFFFSYETLLIPSFFILYNFAKTRRCVEAAYLMFF
jgi:hypothetical protein